MYFGFQKKIIFSESGWCINLKIIGIVVELYVGNRYVEQ